MGSAAPVLHRTLERLDGSLMQTLRDLVALQRRAAAGAAMPTPDPAASTAVSPEALDALLATGTAVSDIRANPGISNCLVFNTTGLDGAVEAPEVVGRRQHVDRMVNACVRSIGATAAASGHFLYPEGGYMGWHTNDRVPGWRLYITNVEDPAASFFRYRSPQTGEIVTSWDTEWDLRIFRIDPVAPLWHAVYSETNRTSLGYRVQVDHEVSATDIAESLISVLPSG